MPFPGGSGDKESASNMGNPGLIPGSGKPPGEGGGHPFPYSCLENPVGGGAWWATVDGVAESGDGVTHTKTRHAPVGSQI